MRSCSMRVNGFLHFPYFLYARWSPMTLSNEKQQQLGVFFFPVVFVFLGKRKNSCVSSSFSLFLSLRFHAMVFRSFRPFPRNCMQLREKRMEKEDSNAPSAHSAILHDCSFALILNDEYMDGRKKTKRKEKAHNCLLFPSSCVVYYYYREKKRKEGKYK